MAFPIYRALRKCEDYSCYGPLKGDSGLGGFSRYSHPAALVGPRKYLIRVVEESQIRRVTVLLHLPYPIDRIA